MSGQDETFRDETKAARLIGRECAPPSKRELSRAAVLDRTFHKIALRHPDANMCERYRLVKGLLPRRFFAMTRRHFQRVWKKWDATRTPTALIRDRRPGLRRASRDHVGTIVQFAVTHRLPLSEAFKTVHAMDASVPCFHTILAAKPPVKILRNLSQLNRTRKRVDAAILQAQEAAAQWLHAFKLTEIK